MDVSEFVKEHSFIVKRLLFSFESDGKITVFCLPIPISFCRLGLDALLDEEEAADSDSDVSEFVKEVEAPFNRINGNDLRL